MSEPTHGLDRILETVVYYREENRDAMRRFYDDVLRLGTSRVSSFGYRLGSSVLLIFDADRSVVQKSPPAHGTSGRAHACFVAVLMPIPPASWRPHSTTASARNITASTVDSGWQVPPNRPG